MNFGAGHTIVQVLVITTYKLLAREHSLKYALLFWKMELKDSVWQLGRFDELDYVKMSTMEPPYKYVLDASDFLSFLKNSSQL